MLVSILIASLRPQELKQCLESIHKCSADIDYEVVVVSPFDIEPHPRVVHVKEAKAEGNYNAVAKGYKQVKGEYVVVLPDDCIVTQNWLSNMIAFMRPHDNEIFQGRFRQAAQRMFVDGSIDDTFIEKPLFNYFGYMFSPFPCMRKDKIDQIGGLFDNKLLRGFWGDADLGLRVWNNGGRVETCRDAVIVAYPCLDELDKTSKEKYQASDEEAFCKRWEPMFGDLFAIFDIYGPKIACPKCGKEYQWHTGDKRRCWHCGKLAYPIMLKGGKTIDSWVSIVIPHAGPVELLKRSIETIKSNTSTLHDIIVIDDKPDSETRAYLASLSKEDVEVVVNPQLMGVEQALNNGFQRARGRYICLLTTSYELSSGSIEALKDSLETNPEFGWVALPLEERIAFVAGCSMMTTEAFQRVGLWDEAYSIGYGFSDDDYMRRMWNAGYKPHIVDGPRIKHTGYKGKTATAILRGDKEAKERFTKSQVLFQQRWGEDGTNWDNFPVYKETKILTRANQDKNSWIRSRCSLEDTILDVGAADGWVWDNMPYKVTLLDINEFVPHPKYLRVVGDAHNLTYGDNSFDIVVEGELLEHVQNPAQVLKEAVRVASKKVVLTVPAEHYWAPENRPFVPIEEVLKQTGLTKEEQFKKDNPKMIKIHDLEQGYHRRHYTKELLEDELKQLHLTYQIELLHYSGWAFWVAEVYKDGAMKKILCVCNLGYIRSQCLARLLTMRGYEARGAGWMPNSPQRAKDDDYEWADRVISLVDDDCYSQFIASVPTKYHSKIERYNIGPDKWGDINHPDLVSTLTKMINNDRIIGGKTTVEEKKMLCLNLGSFVDVIKDPKWVNIDILALREHIPPEVKFKQCDIRRGIPYPDNSVDLIRASHLIEHLTLEEAKNLLAEMFRVLIPGGIARIATPDLDIIVKRYYNRDMGFFNAVEQPVEYIQAPTMGEKFSRLLFSGDYQHKAIYTWEMLKNFLEQVGFTKIFRSVSGFSHSEVMQMETTDQHESISLFCEAAK